MLISLVPFSFVLAGVARDESRGRRAAEPAADGCGRNLGLLTRAGMELGALNAAGTACPNYHQASGRFIYKTLVLYDAPSQELSHVLYEAMAFIEDALAAGGCIFVHCQQGVSRSATIVLAFLMRERGMSLDAAIAWLHKRRWIRPNEAFLEQLLCTWHP